MGGGEWAGPGSPRRESEPRKGLARKASATAVVVRAGLNEVQQMVKEVVRCARKVGSRAEQSQGGLTALKAGHHALVVEI